MPSILPLRLRGAALMGLCSLGWALSAGAVPASSPAVAASSAVASTAASAVVAQTPEAARWRQLQADLEGIRRAQGVPAVGVVVVDLKGGTFAAGLGQAKPQQAASSQTLFRVGSVSKVFAALAVMKLVEQGRLNLQTPLRELVPEIAFDNPWEAQHPVRLVHLLEHTTGWEDTALAESLPADHELMDLSAVLAQRPATRRSRWVPGTRSAYSNLGAVAVALVVQKAAGMPYEQFVRQSFLSPLGMKTSGFTQDEAYRQLGAELHPAAHPGRVLPYQMLRDWPAGALHSSPDDMARLLAYLLQGQAPSASGLPSLASIERMRTPTTTLGAQQGLKLGHGLGHESSGHGGSGLLFHGHDGALEGAITRLVYSPELGRGFVLMTSNDDYDAMFQMSRRLHQHLLEGVTPQSLPQASSVPGQWTGVEGWYRHGSPRQELTRLTSDLMGLSHFSWQEGRLVQRDLFDGEDAYVPTASGLLVDVQTGLPSLARVQDPVAGEALQAGANTLVRVSAWVVWGAIALWTAWLAASLLEALCLAAAGLRTLGGHAIQWKAPRLLLLGASLSFAWALIAGRVLGRGDEDFATVTWISLSVCLGTLAMALLCVAGSVSLWRAWRRPPPSASRWTRGRLTLFALLQWGVLAYLWAYGMVGVRTWV